MTDPIELSASAFTTVSILLAARNSVHTWWTGIVGCVLFAVTFFQVALYADVTLQGFFLVTSVLGWWHWQRGQGGASKPISRTTRREWTVAVLMSVAVTGGYGWLLSRLTDAYAPFLDSAVLALSVVAQIFLLRRRLENWPVWVVVNTLSVPLYASRGLWLTSLLYAAYWINAWYGWWTWRRVYRAQTRAAEAAPGGMRATMASVPAGPLA